jgi:subtilisin family serine protease
MNWVMDDIAVHQAAGRDKWILVNSWAVYDRRTEYPPNDYTNNPGHAFNLAMKRADAMGIDVVFAAGNCGGFCPKSRCGPDDRGQEASILGANSLGCVLTAGAVRPDGVWIGYSSQGPGQSNLSTAKPDLCAPSQFADDDDENPVNSGTSTSAALAAGTIAALRSLHRKATLTPEEMRALLRDTARAGDPGEDDQFGRGILDAANALAELPA